VFVSIGFLFDLTYGPSIFDWQADFLPFFALSLPLPTVGIWMLAPGFRLSNEPQ
jgi:hypothetical protein